MICICDISQYIHMQCIMQYIAIAVSIFWKRFIEWKHPLFSSQPWTLAAGCAGEGQMTPRTRNLEENGFLVHRVWWLGDGLCHCFTHIQFMGKKLWRKPWLKNFVASGGSRLRAFQCWIQRRSMVGSLFPTFPPGPALEAKIRMCLACASWSKGRKAFGDQRLGWIYLWAAGWQWCNRGRHVQIHLGENWPETRQKIVADFGLHVPGLFQTAAGASAG